MHTEKNLIKYGDYYIYKRLPLFLQYHQVNKHNDLSRAVLNTLVQDFITAIELAEPETIIAAEGIKISKNYLNARVSDTLAAADVNFVPVTKIQVAGWCLRVLTKRVNANPDATRIALDLIYHPEVAMFTSLRQGIARLWLLEGKPTTGLLYDQKESILSICAGFELLKRTWEVSI
jgi:hypothetical protein